MAHVNNFSDNGTNGLALVQWNLLGGNGSARARWGNTGTSQAYVFDPHKVKIPLLEPYLGAGATEEQLAYLIEWSQTSWSRHITPRMRAPMSGRDAAALVDFIYRLQLGSASEFHCPVPDSPKSEWMKWILVIRKSTGLGDWSLKDKVFNRVSRLLGTSNDPTIALEKGESLRVWLLVILTLALLGVALWVGLNVVPLAFAVIYCGGFSVLRLAKRIFKRVLRGMPEYSFPGLIQAAILS